MTPRAGNTSTHGRHRAAASTDPSGMRKASRTHPANDTVIPTAGRHAAASPRQHGDHGTHSHSRPAAKSLLQSTIQILLFVCIFWRSRRVEEQKGRGAQGDASTGQEAQLDGSDTCGTAPTSTITHGGGAITSKNDKKKHGGRVWLCVWRCGCLPALAAIKTKQTRGKEMCAPPHRPSSHAHTSRLPQRAVRRGPSSCVQQARRTGPSS
ncbi:hypothetical protein TcCL_Unassigned03022 [Trypanosoma cruzi]|nr:hypothetical protein TcCL_Unassigned03022 [Trypanosoma cruzi]